MFKNLTLLLQCLFMLISYHFDYSFSLPDGLHLTPPMGWSSWNTFFGPGSEEQLMAQVSKHYFTNNKTKIHIILSVYGQGGLRAHFVLEVYLFHSFDP